MENILNETVQTDTTTSVCDECCKGKCTSDFNITGCVGTFSEPIDVNITCTGRVLSTPITLKNVCKGSKVAVAVLIDEKITSSDEKETPVTSYVRTAIKMVTVTIPTTTGNPCTDFTINGICFALPDDLHAGITACSTRTFRARVIANYIGYPDIPCPCSANTISM